jgi:hypothetical protein
VKKLFAVFGVLVLGLLAFGCIGGTQEEVRAAKYAATVGGGSALKTLDLSGTYCGFKIDSLAPEEIMAAGFKGKIERFPLIDALVYSMQDTQKQVGGALYADKNAGVTILENNGGCLVTCTFKSGDHGIFVMMNIGNSSEVAARDYENGAQAEGFKTTNEVGEASRELEKDNGYLLAFYKKNFSVQVTGTYEIADETEKQAVKENVKVIARLIESKT